MDSKLTLKLNHLVIDKAKKYAKSQNTSLSRLIENYLQKIMHEKGSDLEITPLVKSLSGIIHLSPDFDDKREYSDFLLGKYS